MDKQMIEEMARIIAFDLCPDRHVHAKWGEEAQCYSDNNFAECTKIKNVVDKLYNAGYRKIPEGAVVLTGMETEQRFEDLMVAFDEMGFMPNTTHPFPEEYVETWKQRLIFVFGQLRKETAEKFAEKVHNLFNRDIKDSVVYTQEEKYILKDFVESIDEICKEFTEEQ